ncbi:hypothetical protein EAY27_20120 [Vibrio anguillarum]|uniref:hypothetical protein n=1 Tax=Vibrio TaxID=662 RepID=UPI0009B1E67C|nr:MULTISPECIES: hypothetical protein [Vibrio]MBF4257923.1 hypothetical protein [Vibrio anguillarum]MBF4279420.1 hypothetical protein [Vibrio anguillarum]MBF4300257.1 hypothetical protein [Vibrio anguillarum]MBF4360915.1 hypothetical protein [Vibrio anguillarum]MBF4399846.1 hypothetical protein [Vibrio anguillarum]
MKSKINQIVEFMEENKELREQYNTNCIKSFIATSNNAKEVIYSIFINSLKAGKESNLSSNGDGAKFFFDKLDSLPDSECLDYRDFIKHFGCSNPKELFSLLEQRVTGMGAKKAALFMRDLDFCQRKARPIFTSYNEKVASKSLVIPVDAVIRTIYDRLGLVSYKEKDYFNSINAHAKQEFSDQFMIIEDLWFWGYFSTKGSENNREIIFNEAKFYTDSYIYPNRQLENKINEFICLLK